MPRQSQNKKQAEQRAFCHDRAWAEAKIGAKSTAELLDFLDRIRTYYLVYWWTALENHFELSSSYALKMFGLVNQLFIDIEVHKVPAAGALGNHIYKHPIIIQAHEDFSDLVKPC